MAKITYDIQEKLGVLSSKKGWNKELNLISWNGFAPKYDIRDWDEQHEKMGKGVTLSEAELCELYNCLQRIFGDGSDSKKAVQKKKVNMAQFVQDWVNKAPLFVQELKNVIAFLQEQSIPVLTQKAILENPHNDQVELALRNEIESLQSIYSVQYNQIIQVLNEWNEQEIGEFFEEIVRV